MNTKLLRKFRNDERGISTVITIMLSLVLIVIIVGNVFLSSYQMNQIDWEKMREDIVILNATPNRVYGSYNPSQYVLKGSTSLVSGTLASLTSDDGTYMNFRSYYSGSDNLAFVENNISNVDLSSNKGIHSNFSAMQSGPDSVYDTLTESMDSAYEYGQAFKSSSTRVYTSSGTPVDDTGAILNINLIKNSTLFAIYNAGNDYNLDENRYGMGCAINVDGVDVAFSWQAPTCVYDACSITVVYAANMTTGSHVIKGRFFANAGTGNTVLIDARQIVAYWFPNVAASFVRSNSTSTTTSSSPVDDPQANLTFTLSSNSTAFILYNAGNKHGSTEAPNGKGVTLNIDGSDIATKEWQSTLEANCANAVTIAYMSALTAGSHTVKGRFFSNSAGSTVTINERQLIVFCFPTNAVTYGFLQSTSSVSTTSTSFVDDSQAVLTRSLSNNSDCLMMYVAGNPYGSTEHWEGKGVELQIDGTGISNSSSWQSPYQDNYANSATSLWSQQLTNGTHTIKGKFCVVVGGTVTVSHRQLLMIAFNRNNYQLDLEAQWTNAPYNLPNEQLCIFGADMGAEDLQVDFWNGSTWLNLFPDLTSGWNNCSVAAYLKSQIFTIRFKGGMDANDPTRDSWNIDVVLLHCWYNEYTSEVEFVGSGDTTSWSQINWTLNSAWTSGSVNVSLQLYNFALDRYSTSGNGFMFYVSNSTPNNDENKIQTISTNLADFKNATGYWKIKAKGIKADDVAFNFKPDFINMRTDGNGGANLTFKNEGTLTLHLVSLWVINSTLHQRYEVNTYINSGETSLNTYSNVALPADPYDLKVVTERGNIAVYPND